jgi:hypothetical protein
MEINNHVQTLATSSSAKESRYSLDGKVSTTQVKSERKEEDRISNSLFSLISIFS